MTDEKQNLRISRFLSLVLRHRPEVIGLTLDDNGWADVQSLIEKSNTANVPLNMELLKDLVDNNSKKRFAFNEHFNKIRASQGHSIEVDLGLKGQIPPSVLYHGTGSKSVPSILEKGLLKGKRQHVHLSADIETAKNVGQRHGKPFIFEVLAEQMYKDNYTFLLSDNGVWLTDKVPREYLNPLTAKP